MGNPSKDIKTLWSGISLIKNIFKVVRQLPALTSLPSTNQISILNQSSYNDPRGFR